MSTEINTRGLGEEGEGEGEGGKRRRTEEGGRGGRAKRVVRKRGSSGRAPMPKNAILKTSVCTRACSNAFSFDLPFSSVKLCGILWRLGIGSIDENIVIFTHLGVL